MTRMILLADGERELDALPVDAIHRATVIVLFGERRWWVLKSPRGKLGESYETELAALEAAL